MNVLGLTDLGLSRALTARVVLCCSLLFAAVGCAGTYRHTLDYNPHESLRVAVLPFAHFDSEGKMIVDDGKLLVDQVVLVSQEQKDVPATAVRKIVQAELARSTAVDTLVPVLVDIELPHHGFARPDGSPDLERLYAAPAAAVCRNFLDCDAVLYGYIRGWDRDYYGLQSVNSVELELRLVSAKDNRVLFSAVGKDSESRGLTKGPTGYSSIVLEPIRGLDSEIIAGLAERTVREMLKPLSVKLRDPMLADPPPAIFATAHDAAASGVIEAGAQLVVVMFGSSGQTASFSIGTRIEDIPMLERSPGHYVGEFFPLPSDQFSSEPVIVSLRDRYGRVSTQTIKRGSVSVLATR